ncbi:MAG: TRAP transporter large permease [Firmicutes bacterium]|jgi:tripartite ATP-independent transporter DctM subunit|nr:TRAP transporter large permease [Bacillota bacterium]
MTGWLLIPFAALLLTGAPIAFALAVASFSFLSAWNTISFDVIPQRMFGGIDSFPLMAIPFFILAGELMNATGITVRLVRFAHLIVGRVPGGLAQANVVASIFFAGLTGAGVADTSAIGSILIPAMVEEGYSPEYSAAVTASSSVIGPIIPPSIVMVIYGSTVGLSIGALFAAGFVPGLLIGLGLMVVCHYYAIKLNHPRRLEPVTIKEFLIGFKDAFIALLMPLIIIGGILSGMFTPTEAAAVAVGYALLAGVFVFRTLTFKSVMECMAKTARTSSIILFIIGSAAVFGWAMTVERVPQQIAELFLSITDSPAVMLMLINVFLLIMGMFMETGANVIILAPILAPIAAKFGIHPLHFALVMIVNLNIGLATPPLGVCLFVACPIAGVTLEELTKAILPFLLVEIAVLLLITYIPWFILVVPRMLGFA